MKIEFLFAKVCNNFFVKILYHALLL